MTNSPLDGSDLKEIYAAADDVACGGHLVCLMAVRDAVIEACAQVAMDMPLNCSKDRHSYRWTDTAKAMAWDIAHAIRSLKNAAPQEPADAGECKTYTPATPAVADPEVCEVCGGRASACRVLGHRPAHDKTEWRSGGVGGVITE